MFDRIHIINNKGLSDYVQLKQNEGLSLDMPDFFIKATSKSKLEGEYLFNYFNFPQEFNLFLKESKDQFKYFSPYDNKTLVKKLCANKIEEAIFDKNNKFRECIIEIKHESCPACFMLGKTFDHLSLKLNKHNILKKLPLFRIDNDNDVPLFGKFSATPMYIYIRKNRDNTRIEAINTLDKNDFIVGLRKSSRLNLNEIRYHNNLMVGFSLYQNKLFSKPDFNPDFDVQAYDKH